ncbi:hypothetical protein D3C83_48220 [compost metagenome]
MAKTAMPATPTPAVTKPMVRRLPPFFLGASSLGAGVTGATDSSGSALGLSPSTSVTVSVAPAAISIDFSTTEPPGGCARTLILPGATANGFPTLAAGNGVPSSVTLVPAGASASATMILPTF